MQLQEFFFASLSIRQDNAHAGGLIARSRQPRSPGESSAGRQAREWWGEWYTCFI